MTVVLTRTVDAATAAEERVWEPRRDVVVEVGDGPGRFRAQRGPFGHYERTVQAGSDGGVTETTSYRLAPLVWTLPFGPLYRRALSSRPRRGVQPWWAPPEIPDAAASVALGAACTLAVVFGYLGSLLTQTVTFAADAFDASKADQSLVLASVRVGVLGAVFLTALADRTGRRRILLLIGTVGCLASALTALVPGLVALAVVQSLVRGLTAAGAVLLGIYVAEEMPAGSRAYAVSLTAMAGALGVGMGLWVLPLADLDQEAWRLPFALALVWLLVLRLVARHMVESRRFATPHRRSALAEHGGRFWLLAVSALLLGLFTAPASQLMNEFLRDERGFSAARISIFTIVTNTPGGLGVIVGGRLADVRGRRLVGAVGVVGGTALTVAMVLTQGWPMWAMSVLGAVIGAITVPALGVYGPELFPTSLRGRANGIISVLGVTGSVVGLVTAGVLSDRWSFGPALAVLSVGPAIMAGLVIALYPETAHRELEELNPEDRPPPSSAPRPGDLGVADAPVD